MSFTNYKEWSKDCYSADFKNHLSPLTKKLTQGRCVLCGRKAKITHHAYYTHKGARDKPGVNLFPVCKTHHTQAHSPANWKKTSPDPVKGRANTAQFLEKLRQGWNKYSLKQKARQSESYQPLNVSRKLTNDQYNAFLMALGFFTLLIVVFAR